MLTAPTHDHLPAIIHALLGDKKLRPLQEDVLSLIRTGSNTLAVFGTGQGKSVCFHIPAFENALKDGSKTIIFYPLRSLANDQYEMLKKTAELLDVRLFRANGSITQKERDLLDTALADGSWDILIATPEFAQHHTDRLGQDYNKAKLIVLDEAHHLLESRHRGAYRRFAETLKKLGSPQTAAFTATARKETFDHIKETLNIDSWVINPTMRENLHIVDARNTKNKDAYILKLAREANGKTIVYCNSRKVTAQIAEDLRQNGIKGVACYNAEMPNKQRREVEDQFRRGELHFMIATSAFGEGIDLPDVRNIILYHLNFDMVSFNQMSGRAGRDGDISRIHLLYGEKDRAINDYIMQKACPSISMLRLIYKEMKKRFQGEEIRGTYAEFERQIHNRDIDAASISMALKIFSDVGLAHVEKDTESRGVIVNLLTPPEDVDITDSERFEEGQATLEAFNQFCKHALTEKASNLQIAISKPIYPKDIPLKGGEANNKILDW